MYAACMQLYAASLDCCWYWILILITNHITPLNWSINIINLFDDLSSIYLHWSPSTVLWSAILSVLIYLSCINRSDYVSYYLSLVIIYYLSIYYLSISQSTYLTLSIDLSLIYHLFINNIMIYSLSISQWFYVVRPQKSMYGFLALVTDLMNMGLLVVQSAVVPFRLRTLTSKLICGYKGYHWKGCHTNLWSRIDEVVNPGKSLLSAKLRLRLILCFVESWKIPARR